MSELSSTNVVNETEAFAASPRPWPKESEAEPQLAAGKVIDSLRAAFGPIVEKIVALIESGETNLPATRRPQGGRHRAAAVGQPRRHDPHRGDEAAVSSE